MTRARELVPGNCYFMVHYYDDDLKIPDVSTYLYEREDEWEDGQKVWLFREPNSDVLASDDEAGGEEELEQPAFMGIREDQLHQMVDLGGLIGVLGELIHLHPLLQLPPAAPDSLAPRTDIPDLADIIGKVLEFQDRHSVTITLLHTDDGFSLTRDPEGLHASFFPKVRLEAAHEREIRATFGELGIAPYQDYLAQHGRVRVLGYRLPVERQLLEGLAKKLLIDVYSMGRDDTLHVSWALHPAPTG
jgi:hypothetical protein